MSEEAAGAAEPPQLSEAFHKTRRQLALLSGILLAWEYVGIRLGESADSTLPGDVKVTIQNAEAIPSVIVLLILYFVLRLTIEWNQNASSRRVKGASRIDLGTAYALALAAIAAFVLQRATDLRIAEVFTPLFIAGTVVGLIATGGFYLFVRALWPELKTPAASARFAVGYGIFVVPVAAVIIGLLSGEQLYPDYNIGIAAGAAVFVVVNLLYLFALPPLKARLLPADEG